VELAGRVQRHFVCHQDIEWAIARVGAIPESLFVLQSRPVTTSPPKDAGATRRQSAMALVMSTFGAARDTPER